MRVNFAILSIVLFCVTVFGQTPNNNAITQFAAKVSIYNDPSVFGILTGSYAYNFLNSTEAVRKVVFSVGPTEIFKWSRGSANRYLKCTGTCETETYSGAIEFPFRLTTDTPTTAAVVNGVTCNGWTRTATNTDTSIQTVYINTNNQLCRIVYATGRVMDFTDFSTTVPSNTFAIDPSCPQPVCNVQMDVVFILDISGSISNSNFNVMRNFTYNLANSFNIGPDAVRIGIAFFDSNAYKILDLSNSKTTVLNTIQSFSRPSQGATCISCGLIMGRGMIPATRNGQVVSKIFIVMTDGVANVNNFNLAPAVKNASDYGVSTFSIGVGSVNYNQLVNISSKIDGVQTVFTVNAFNDLQNLLNNGFVAQTCQNLPGSSCGVNCRGFCSCDRTCLCPDTCDDGNACTNDACTVGQNGNGCQYKTATCDDGNFCTDNQCNPSSGCFYTNKSANYCSDNDLCTDDICVPSLGCQNPPKDCNDGNPCSIDTCNPSNGQCQHNVQTGCVCATKVCPFINNCTQSYCDVTTGECTTAPVVCDDGNICTTDVCLPASGCSYSPRNCSDNNACTVDTCDRNVEGGCVRTPYNVSFYDDSNACTNDTCDPIKGIQHTRISCVDGNACTEDICESVTGCIYRDYDCGVVLGSAVATQCDIALCNVNATGVPNGCYVGQAQGAKYDECGECFGKGLNCVSKVTVGIGAGIISAITIGALAAAGAIFAGSFGGVKAYQKYRANMQGAQSNPMYQEKTAGSGINPMYSDTSLTTAT